jgi:hypothetical protein
MGLKEKEKEKEKNYLDGAQLMTITKVVEDKLLLVLESTTNPPPSLGPI